MKHIRSLGHGLHIVATDDLKNPFQGYGGTAPRVSAPECCSPSLTPLEQADEEA